MEGNFGRRCSGRFVSETLWMVSYESELFSPTQTLTVTSSFSVSDSLTRSWFCLFGWTLFTNVHRSSYTCYKFVTNQSQILINQSQILIIPSHRSWFCLFGWTILIIPSHRSWFCLILLVHDDWMWNYLDVVEAWVNC